MFSQCHWHNAPPAHTIHENTLTVVTGADTDFWRITSYDFIHDNGHFLAMPVSGDFTAQLRIRAAFSEMYDQAGLMVRLDERRWIKAGIECSDNELMMSTVLTNEQSDWAVAVAPEYTDGFWLRVTVSRGAIRVQYSIDGIVWPMLRLAPFPVAERYLVGPMCCTPKRAGLEVNFSDFSLGPPLDKGLHDLS